VPTPNDLKDVIDLPLADRLAQAREKTKALDIDFEAIPGASMDNGIYLKCRVTINLRAVAMRVSDPVQIEQACALAPAPDNPMAWIHQEEEMIARCLTRLGL